MKQLSILLPSFRPDNLTIALAAIKKHTTIDYEILTDTKTEGCYQAIKKCYQKAKGKYIVCLADDVLVTPGWAEGIINFMQPHDGKLFEGGFRFYDKKGICPELGTFGLLYSRVPVLHRDTVRAIHGFIDTRLVSYFGDPDIANRVWVAGGQVQIAPNLWLYSIDDQNDPIHKRSFDRYYSSDKRTFKQIWEPEFGRAFAGGDEYDPSQLLVGHEAAQPPEGIYEKKEKK